MDSIRSAVSASPSLKNIEFELFETTKTRRQAALLAASLVVQNWQYSLLSARLHLMELYDSTPCSFSLAMERLHRGEVLSPVFAKTVKDNAHELDSQIKQSRDNDLTAIGLATLKKSYLLRDKEGLVERPQYLYMRIAVALHGANLESVFETYDLLSRRLLSHATPTMFNAGTRNEQLASCFLLPIKGDSIGAIYDTVKQCATISKHAGGIGLSISNVRASGSAIKGTGGVSNGIVPMLKVFNETAAYVDQGGGKRKGGFAAYLECWHADIMDFLEMKRPQGAPSRRARDLFYALWVSDLFMNRVKEDGLWSLFCPSDVKLYDCYGEEFEQLYLKAEREKLWRRQLPAREVFDAMTQSQLECGVPYVLFKDACNKKSNQKNLGTIRSSNLCAEIIEYTSPDEAAVCTLASISLPKCLDQIGGRYTFNYKRLQETAKVAVRNLDRVIDINFYPIVEAHTSNMRHRPIGLGVNGLHDVFFALKLPWRSKEASQMNRALFEALYFAALSASVELAEEKGAYSTFEGSPMSEDQLQFDLWNVQPSDRWDWASLRKKIQRVGCRNSLLIALMPTASSATIAGNCEGTDPLTSNLYVRKLLSGEYIVLNKYLQEDLQALGVWEEVKGQLIESRGSLQGVLFPASVDAKTQEHLRDLYRTAYELPQKSVIDMAADRGAFVCQSASTNLHITRSSKKQLTACLMHSWARGCKTGCYYCRSKPAVNAIQFTVQPRAAVQPHRRQNAHRVPNVDLPSPVVGNVCEDKESCEACGA